MKGIYLLIIEVKKDLSKKIGGLGDIFFEKGYYVYVGSAQNSLEKRIERHFCKKKKLWWHIDYLLEERDVVIEEVLFKTLDKSWECKVAKSVRGIPIYKFGSSDCNCKSHLYKVDIEEILNFKRLGFLNYVRVKNYGT